LQSCFEVNLRKLKVSNLSFEKDCGKFQQVITAQLEQKVRDQFKTIAVQDAPNTDTYDQLLQYVCIVILLLLL